MKLVVKVEHVLVDATPMDAGRLAISDRRMNVVGVESRNAHAVVLVSNYRTVEPTEAELTVRVENSSDLIDLDTDRTLAQLDPTNPTASVTIDRCTKLFYVRPNRDVYDSPRP